jgi:hypothetical protein
LDENQHHTRSVLRQDNTNIIIHVHIEVRTHDPLVPVVQESTRVTLQVAVVGTVFYVARGPPTEYTLTVCTRITGVQKVEPLEIYTYFIYKINFKKSAFLPHKSRHF